MAYESRDVPVVDLPDTSKRLIVHMCQAGGEDVVEFIIPASDLGEAKTVVIRRLDFSQMVSWVEKQFAILSNEVRHVN